MLSDVPAPLAIKLDVTHVCAEDLRYGLAGARVDNFALEVVFWVVLHTSIAYLIKSCQSIGLVREVDPARDLMHQGTAPQRILGRVGRRIKCYPRAILEDDFLIAFDVEVDRIEVGLGRK